MERKKFLKGSFSSMMGISMIPFMASNNFSENFNNDSEIDPSFLHSNHMQDIYNVYDYGVQGNGKKLDTKALQQAIDACHKAGGGIVVFPQGDFLTGTLFLKDYVFLKLRPSATILGSTNLSDYDSEHPHLIYAKDAQHAGIIGEGNINGQGDSFWRGKDRPYHRPGAFITFETSKQMVLKGIDITNTPGWTVFLKRCDRVHIDGLSIVNDQDSPNTDGIDPISSSNVFISNCYIDTGDDAICLKAGKERSCENIVVTNCILRSEDSAIKCCTSDYGNIKHCVFNNIIIWDTTFGIAFFVKDEETTYENMQFSNINIKTKEISKAKRASLSKHDLQHLYPIFMDIEPRTPNSGLGTIHNISLKNISIDTWNGNCLIQGRKNKYIENISLDNIHMRVHSRTYFIGRTKPRGTRTLKKKASNDFSDVPAHFTFGNIAGLTLNNITVEDVSEDKTYQRHEVWGTNLKDVDIAKINYKPAPADKTSSVINLQDCKNVLIKESRAPVSKASFINIEGEKTSNINVIGNDFFQVKQGVELKNVDKNILFESANRQPESGS